jgi:Family of unknown function (DUF6088)
LLERTFPIGKENELSLAKSLSRLAKSGKIVRLSKGKYYKPRESTFGQLKPNENQIIQALTMQRDRRIGYVTGLAAFNALGLTTQVPNTIVIAKNNMQQSREIDGLKIRFITRKIDINEEDVILLQLLDAIKDIKNIPDATVADSIKVITAKLKELSQVKLRQLIKLSFHYPASTRALLGAIIENNFSNISISSLYKSLNPLSKYHLGINESILQNKEKWNIE